MAQEEKYNPYASKALALKLILREDVSYRIVDAINAAVYLESNIAFAEKVKKNELDSKRVNELEWKIHTIPNPKIRKAYEKEYEKLVGSATTKQKDVSVWDREAYKIFYESFLSLWKETRDNIRDEEYPRHDELGKDKEGRDIVVRYGTKGEIELLFYFGRLGEHNPRGALDLFQEYMTALFNSKMTNFRTTSISDVLARSF